MANLLGDGVAARAADDRDGSSPSGGPTTSAGPGPDVAACRPLVVVIVVACVLPLLAGMVVLAFSRYRPIIDTAIQEIRIRDVGGPSTPLLSSASTAGGGQGQVNHPGPLNYYYLAAFYRLLGSSSKGPLFGVGLLNLASVAGVLWLSFRRGGVRLMAVAGVVVAVLLRGLGLQFLFDDWVPWLPTVPFLLLLFLVWSVTCGDLVVLPLTVLVWSWVVQTHLSYGLYSAALLLWLLVGGGLAIRRAMADADADADGGVGPDRAAVRRRALWLVGGAVAVGVVCWIPPIIDQLTHEPGNLGQLIHYVFSPKDQPTAGLSTGTDVTARELGGWAPWISGAEGSDLEQQVVSPASPLWLLIPLGALAAAVALSWRRRASDELRLQVTVGVALLATVPSAASITGALNTHWVRAMWPIAAVLWIAVGWSLTESVASARPDLRAKLGRPALAVAVVAMAVLGVATVVGRPTGLTNNPRRQELAGVADAVVPRLTTAGPVVVDSDGSTDGWTVQVGLQLALERAGIPVAVPGDKQTRAVYGDERVQRTPASHLIVATGDQIAAAKAAPGRQVLFDGSAGGTPVVVLSSS